MRVRATISCFCNQTAGWSAEIFLTTSEFLGEKGKMAKKKINLTDAQMVKNAEILRRIEEEKAALIAETRAIQEDWNNRKRRRRRKSDL